MDAPDLISESAWTADRPLYLRVAWTNPVDHPMYAFDLVEALWNVELLYDFAVLLGHPAYQEFNLKQPRVFFASGPESVAPQHKLQVLAVEHHSPLLFLAIIPAVAAGAGAVWAVTQTVEKVANFRLNRQLLREQATKAKAETRRAEAEAESAEYQRQLDQRRANDTMEQLKNQIENMPMKIIDAEITDQRPAA